jgi:AmmeMemoRadiSam system protein A
MPLSKQERDLLLRLAREALEAEVAGRRPPEPPQTGGELAEERGVFVTLTNRGRLRGCIGTFQPTRPLVGQVIEMAAEAARDPRFVYERITPDEVPDLTIGISVLSPLEPVEDPLSIELGVHGIYVLGPGGRGGCFLPEVADETGWTKEEFLSHCCGGKAGMAPDAWKSPDTRVLVFTTEKFDDGQ